MRLDDRCQNIELILSDVDGVLTDGGILFDNQGIEIKQFHIRDGMGIQLWKRAGYQFGLITARTSHIVQVRASELDVDFVRQGFQDKLTAAYEVFQQRQVAPEKVCFIGDDLPDLKLIKAVGLGVAVADAPVEVQSAAHYVTTVPGGRGAVRETIEMILKQKKRWAEVVGKYD
jgi:YrbI family 3-deoxy-D-manno-octulosonate 8-phosphate phosphatase